MLQTAPKTADFPMPKAPWDRPERESDKDSAALGVASGMVPRSNGPGRKSNRFPNINIAATAEVLGCTRSHLSNVLAGASKPSIGFAAKLADALDRDLNYVAALYKGKRSKLKKRKTE